MRTYPFLGATALASFLSLILPAAALAQAVVDTGKTAAVKTADAAASAADEENSIVVTGTRINRPNITSAVPITSLTGDELIRTTGNVSIGDTLNQLPQLRATFTQANSTRNIGTAGITALDLRGLGTARTLVLVDGRRLITATPGQNRPDVNDVPTDLIERVDIVTAGNSAIYGSDAVAGVVNFILKQDFEGFAGRAQGGVSSRSDRGQYFVDLTAGHNFGENRGNIAVSAEYVREDTLAYTDREGQTGAFNGRSQFNLVENPGPISTPAPARSTASNRRRATASPTTPSCAGSRTTRSRKAASTPPRARPLPAPASRPRRSRRGVWPRVRASPTSPARIRWRSSVRPSCSTPTGR